MIEKDYTIPAAEGTKQIVGTGPYKFKSWTPGDRLVLERWDGYKPNPKPSSYQVGYKAAYVDQIMYVEIPDHATRVAALETGEVSFLDEFKSDFAARVKNNPDLRLYPVPPGNNLILVFNHTRPPFDNVKVRQAIRLAYPNEDALRVAVGDPSLWQLCPSMMMCGSRWESRVAESLYNKRDIKAALQLIKEAGAEGAVVRHMSPEDMPVLPDASLVTRALLESLGFKVDYQSMDWATLVQRRSKPDQWETFHTWGSRDWSLLNPMSNVAITPKGWWNQYQDTTGKMTNLRSQFARAVTSEQQKKIIDQMTQVFWEDLPVVIAGQFFPVMASRKEVQGYEVFPDPVFYNLWLGK
jgi:peptide/nickel transport system substrate-binding protein